METSRELILAECPTLEGHTFSLVAKDTGDVFVRRGGWSRDLAEAEMSELRKQKAEVYLEGVVLSEGLRPKYRKCSTERFRPVYTCDCLRMWHIFVRQSPNRDRPKCPLCGEEMAFLRIDEAQ